ncbi:MAG TPA: hypothetical protein VGR42_12860 [Casimicrobiaceae bacterium]|nr:hypothetical protein [Casimicrobiaceae bacterium]
MRWPWLRFATTAFDEGDLNIDERIVADLVSACRVVAAKVNELPALS